MGVSWSTRTVSFLIGGLALLLFVPFLGGAHLFDWDEINFAEAAREMILTGEYSYVQIDFKPFWEKPPLFIWMQVLSMKLFGINAFAARFPNAICGALSLVVLFRIGTRTVSKNFGLLWVLVYAGSFLPQFYFRSGIIDPWFNLLIFSGIHQLILATEKEVITRKNLLISGLLIGLAVLTKGPTALALVGLCCLVFFVLKFKNYKWKIFDGIFFLSTILFVGFSWFLIEILRGRGYIVQEFIDYHIRLLSESEAGHGQPFYYHPIVLLVGCFPMSLFFIFGWISRHDTQHNSSVQHYRTWMKILFWVVLVVFSVVKTKIIHYSSLTYFPMSFLATYSIWQLLKGNWELKRWHQFTIIVFSVVFGTAFILLGTMETIKQPLLQLLKNDLMAVRNFSQKITDGPFDTLLGIGFLFGISASLFLLYRKQATQGIIGLFGTSLISLSLVSVVLIPKIDGYTQTSLFNFYAKHAEKAYFVPLGYHTYAHLFYGKQQPKPTEIEDELKWTVFEKVDRPVYFIVRAHNLEQQRNYFPHLQEIGRRGGYVILERTDENYPFLESK